MERRLKLVKRRPLWLVFGAVLLLLAAVLGWFYAWSGPEPRQSAPPVSQTPDPAAEPPSISFAAMGDMLAHDSVVSQARSGEGYDFSGYFSEIKPLYSDSDVVFCNSESPSAGQTYGISGYPTFNAPVEFARDLVGAGCNLISLANNHMADKGQAALNATLDVWDNLEILAHSGANRSLEEQNTIKFFEKNGIKVGFLAFADFSNAALPHSHSVNLFHDRELVSRLMTQARAKVDVVVVSTHWGVEDSHMVSEQQRQVGQMLADLGADVIIGTGPHVLQPVEWLERSQGGRTLVWYSIGNMLSSQLYVDQLTGGVAKFTATKTDEGIEISDIGFEGTFMSYEWTAADRRAMRLGTRRNLRLQPLTDAEDEVRLFDVTVEERAQKLREWLGDVARISP